MIGFDDEGSRAGIISERQVRGEQEIFERPNQIDELQEKVKPIKQHPNVNKPQVPYHFEKIDDQDLPPELGDQSESLDQDD